jgi:hypothetical protein
MVPKIGAEQITDLIPYFSQWESVELVGSIIRGEMSAGDDPRWRESGAESPEEYAFWSWRVCGMACLRSILAVRGIRATTVGLAKEVLAAGGYVRRDGGLDGLIYAPFVEYLRTRWELEATVRPQLDIDELGALVDRGECVMASVNPRIRRPSDRPERKGGHLVLVHGVAGDSFVLHNPSGDAEESQAYARVSFDDFGFFFAERGISFDPAWLRPRG